MRNENVLSDFPIFIDEFCFKIKTRIQPCAVLKANGKRTVVLWDGSALLRPSSSIEIGDQLKMVGEWDGEVFVAKGIAKGGDGRVKGLKRVNSYRSQKTNDLH